MILRLEAAGAGAGAGVVRAFCVNSPNFSALAVPPPAALPVAAGAGAGGSPPFLRFAFLLEGVG